MPPLPRLLVLTSLFSVILVLLIATSALPGYGLGFSGGRGGGLSARTPSLFPKSAIITLTDDVTTFFLARPAAFGPELPDAGGSGGGGKGGGGGGGRGREKGLTGRLVAVPDGEDGCGDGEAPPGEDGEETGNALDDGYINGRIVLIPRGGCGFLEKVLWAQRRGALAVVVGDNVSGRGLVTMYAKGDTSNVAIPSIFTTHTTAQLLISLIPRPPTFTPTLPLDPTRSHAPGFHYEDHRGRKSNGGGKREGLWVTLTCTPGPASPLLDTLLVLVVSPLGTLGIVYTMLAIRARLQRRRWRAPKSVVESLPVRVYTEPSGGVQQGEEGTDGEERRKRRKKKRLCGAMRGSGSAASSNVTLVNGASDAPAQPSPHQQQKQPASAPAEDLHAENGNTAPQPQQAPPNIPSSSLECVVCLEDYIPNVSRVMRLPCGHEFHAGCITPWLVTRRRTCPICKGDVVKMVREKGGTASGEEDVERGWEDSSSDESGDEGAGEEAEEEREGWGVRWWRRVVAAVGGGGGRSVAGLSLSGSAGERRRRRPIFAREASGGGAVVDERTPLLEEMGPAAAGVGVVGESSTGRLL